MIADHDKIDCDDKQNNLGHGAAFAGGFASATYRTSDPLINPYIKKPMIRADMSMDAYEFIDPARNTGWQWR